MGRELMMKFSKQLHKPPKCLERKFGKMGAFENDAEQTWALSGIYVNEWYECCRR